MKTRRQVWFGVGILSFAIGAVCIAVSLYFNALTDYRDTSPFHMLFNNHEKFVIGTFMGAIGFGLLCMFMSEDK